MLSRMTCSSHGHMDTASRNDVKWLGQNMGSATLLNP